MKATDFFHDCLGFPCPFSEPGALRFRNRLREGKLSIFVMSAAMPNHRFRPEAELSPNHVCSATRGAALKCRP